MTSVPGIPLKALRPLVEVTEAPLDLLGAPWGSVP